MPEQPHPLDLWDLLPAGVNGPWEIEKVGRNDDRVELRLWRDWELGERRVYMVTNRLEHAAHKGLWDVMHGDVCAAGLGLGYVTLLASASEDTDHMDVIEQDQRVIDLVWPHVQNAKCSVVHAGILDFLEDVQTPLYDVIYFDILHHDPQLYPTEALALRTAAQLKLKPGGVIVWWRSLPEIRLRGTLP